MSGTGNSIGDELDWLDGLIDKARANAELLKDGDIRFVDDMTLKVARFGARTFVSAKQRRWLKRIEADIAEGAEVDVLDPVRDLADGL